MRVHSSTQQIVHEDIPLPRALPSVRIAHEFMHFANRRSMEDENSDDDNDFAPEALTPTHRHQNEYDDDGIRRPDPVQSRRLIRGSHPTLSSAMSMAIGRAEDPSVEWMHPPPAHLSYPGNFVEARTMAKEDKKWLLVNLQSHTEFHSHILNRDTWSNETVETIIRLSFVFWQRGHTSDEGRHYARTYGVKDSDLPSIAVIDPRTGARILTIKVDFLEPLFVDIFQEVVTCRVSSSRPTSL